MDQHQLKLDLSDLLKNIITRIDSISQLYKEAKDSEASERLVHLVEDILVVAQAVGVLQNYKSLDLDELNDKLSNVLEQIELGDSLLIADLLYYELKPLFEYWGEQLQDA